MPTKPSTSTKTASPSARSGVAATSAWKASGSGPKRDQIADRELRWSASRVTQSSARLTRETRGQYLDDGCVVK